MKYEGQSPFSGGGKSPATTITTYSLVNLFSYLFLIVTGFTLGVVFSYSKTFSFNLQLTNGGFSIFTSQSPPPPAKTAAALDSKSNSSGGGGAVTDDSPPSSHAVEEYFLKSPPVTHSMADEELMWRASMVPKIRGFPSNGVPKVAFMFLTRGPVILAPLWEVFFKGHQGMYSIYVHSDPSYSGSDPPGSVFHGRRIPSKEVRWGNVNMVEAERRLLANAILDFSNQYFVLLSESCIPVFNFSTVYSYLLNSTHSYIESYDLPGPVGRGRYNRHMAPLITVDQWRKGSQWFALSRDLAVEVVSDTTYFPAFQKHCHGSCYADEHYLATFASMKFGSRNSNRTLTWVDWSKGGPHPGRFYRQHVTPEFLEWLRSGSVCEYNGKKTNMCYMFARKFTQHALGRLLRFAPTVLHFY
ncbi:glycosyltransferase BC10-like [Andrographis paniculata]|uniref:glycosyltransferase BC10-like n=1 Tax=Andrographis paniculata TaxID=175694 RepID=UPI0021E8F29A|nr:glycosyltransferase BC10-like [Andrographis paniculata]